MDTPLLTDDFKEFLKLLNANRVDYLLVGGYAVGLHGYPRATVDLDIWIRPTPSNAECVLESLRAENRARDDGDRSPHQVRNPSAFPML